MILAIDTDTKQEIKAITYFFILDKFFDLNTNIKIVLHSLIIPNYSISKKKTNF